MNRIMIIVRWCAFLCLAAACGEGEKTGAEPEGKIVKVKLAAATDELSSISRYTTAMDSEQENMINDVWVIQYNAEGIIYPTSTKHYRENAEGERVVSSFEVELATMAHSTVCVVVNLDPGKVDAVRNWPSRLSVFKEEVADLSPWVKSDLSGHLATSSQGIYMSGFYEGPITSETTSINVVLGRLLARVEVNVTNNTGDDLTGMKFALENLVTKARWYPGLHANIGHPHEWYINGEETIGDVENGARVTRYYYTGGNIPDSEEYITKLIITADGGREASGYLRNDPPNVTEDPDNDLHRNNSYTFNLVLK